MRREVNLFRSIDWVTVFIYLLLVTIGFVNIYAAVYNEETKTFFDFSARGGRQFMLFLVVPVFVIIIFMIESKAYAVFAYIIYAIALIMLISVLGVGREVKGARSWFFIGSFGVQPSEFAKIATGLAVAKFLSTFNISLSNIRNLIIAAGIVFFPALWVVMQNDMGSALVYSSFLFVLYREGMSPGILLTGFFVAVLFISSLVYQNVIAIQGVILGVLLLVYWFQRRSWKEVLLGVATIFVAYLLVYLALRIADLKVSLFLRFGFSLIVSVFPFVLWAYKKKLKFMFLLIGIVISSFALIYSVDYIFNEVLEPHQRTRINVLFGIEKDIHGAGYNVYQSKIAIGSGGVSGKGFLQGTQTKFDFVPEQSTDFIFCTIGEEWGFFGTLLLVILYVTLFLRLIYLAERQRSVFSRVYGYAVASIIFFHFAINIGMTIGLAPVIGIPLPFISYGGSSLWAFSVLLFIFVRLDASRTELL